MIDHRDYALYKLSSDYIGVLIQVSYTEKRIKGLPNKKNTQPPNAQNLPNPYSSVSSVSGVVMPPARCALAQLSL